MVPDARRARGPPDHPRARASCAAVNPIYGVQLFESQPLKAFLALGSIFLVVTGGEALYADMGHFGRRPIQISWYCLVLPCLVLNYFGQAALLARDPAAIENPFFNMAPHCPPDPAGRSWRRWPR